MSTGYCSVEGATWDMQNMMDMMTFQVLDNSKDMRRIRARSQKQAGARLSNMLMARAAMLQLSPVLASFNERVSKTNAIKMQ